MAAEAEAVPEITRPIEDGGDPADPQANIEELVAAARSMQLRTPLEQAHQALFKLQTRDGSPIRRLIVEYCCDPDSPIADKKSLPVGTAVLRLTRDHDIDQAEQRTERPWYYRAVSRTGY